MWGGLQPALFALLVSLRIHAGEVAVTFDDLPAAPGHASRLLRSIVAAKVPAIGFVNEHKLSSKADVDVLRRWHAAGLELGNHTYSHRDLHQIGAEEFAHDIVAGENVTRTILGRAPRWRALQDPAYRSADAYAGPAGITWIHRWALTAGKKGAFFAGEPATPQWIQDLAGVRE
jgi:peptidoglycan/xylan/chitin deacetylase (PgdA/CDA1 family)